MEATSFPTDVIWWAATAAHQMTSGHGESVGVIDR